MPEQTPPPTAQTLRVMWAALLATQAAEFGVAFFKAGVVGDDLADNRVLPLALLVAAVAAAGFAHYCWRQASGAGLTLHEAADMPIERRVSGCVVAWATDNAIALFGLLLALFGQPFPIWVGFSAVGAVLMLIHRPVAHDSISGAPPSSVA